MFMSSFGTLRECRNGMFLKCTNSARNMTSTHMAAWKLTRVSNIMATNTRQNLRAMTTSRQ